MHPEHFNGWTLDPGAIACRHRADTPSLPSSGGFFVHGLKRLLSLLLFTPLQELIQREDLRRRQGDGLMAGALMLLMAAALECSRAMDDRDVEHLQMGCLTGGSGLLIGYVLGRRQ